MKLLILLALCGTVYLLPMEMETSSAESVTAADVSGVQNFTITDNSTAQFDIGNKTICAVHTPCAWSIYNPYTRQVKGEIINTYCICSPELICTVTEDDTQVNSYIHRCRPTDYEPDFEIEER